MTSIFEDYEEPSIKRMLHKRIPGKRAPRDYKIVHASDLTKEEEFCPRQFALYDLTGKTPKDEWVGTSQQTTFDIGRMVQFLIREQWMGDAVVGHWACKRCNHMMMFQHRPKECTHCTGDKFSYKEVALFSDELAIWGGLDMLVEVGEPKLRFTEIKIIDKDFWVSLKAPLAEHLWRTKLYLKLIATSTSDWAKRINTDVAHILYKGRMFGKKDQDAIDVNYKDKFSPFKEFIVERDDAALRGIMAKAKELKLFKEGVLHLPGRICKSGFDDRARFCRVAPDCFGRYKDE